MISMLTAALEYHDFGWSVIPLRTAAKKPHIRWKRYQELRPTADEVKEWWSRWPDAGISLILGPVSGVVAVDVDSVEAQQIFFKLLDGEPHTLKSISGSRKPGKAHYLFHCPDFATTARYTPLHPQLEFRGHGGYIALPPGLHPSGLRYAWSQPMREIAELPAALAAAWQSNPRILRRITKTEPGREHQDFGVSRGSLMSILRLPDLSRSTQRWLLSEHAYDGGWNGRLFCAACDLAGLGVSREVAEPLLLRGARPRTAADEESARRTIESAYSNERVPFRDFEDIDDPECPVPTAPAVKAVRIIRPARLPRTFRREVQ